MDFHNHRSVCVFCARVQSLSSAWLLMTTWTAICQASLSFTISQSLLKFMSFESVMLSNHLILCHPHLLLPSVFPSISLFPRVGSLHSMTKVLELKLQQESFQWIDWFDLLAGNGLCKLSAPGKTAYFLWWCLTPNCSDNIPVYNLKKVSWSPFFTYE